MYYMFLYNIFNLCRNLSGVNLVIKIIEYNVFIFYIKVF